MDYIKLNIGWDAEPNAPMPNIEIDKNTFKLTLSFYLNAFIHKDVEEEDMGILEFNDCYKYRLGPVNDEGFYNGQCRFSKTGIQWGDFYQLIDTNWMQDFPEDEIILNNKIEEDLHHYLYYFRDNTFDCVAKSYTFRILRQTPKSDKTNHR